MSFVKFFIIGLVWTLSPFQAYANGKADVYVVGSIHNLHTSNNFPERKFEQILGQAKPDVVLLEFPPEWFDSNGLPRPDLKKALEDENKKDGIRDGQLAWKYCLAYTIPCRPFDIKGRNEFFKKYRVFERLQIFEGELNRYAREFPEYLTALQGFTKLYDECLSASPEVLNGEICDQGFRSREDFVYQLYLKAKKTEDFKDRDFYQLQKDYWDLRNETMAQNICSEAIRFVGKKVVVITGADHHFYLMDLLSKCASANVRNWYSQNYL